MAFEQHWLERLLAATTPDLSGRFVQVLEIAKHLVALFQVQHLRLHLAQPLDQFLG